MRKEIKYGALIAVVLLMFSLLGCDAYEAGEEFDPENDIQDVIFEDYGSQTIGEAAEDMMTDIQWSAQLDPEGDGLMDYLVKLTGKEPTEGFGIEYDFKLTYQYRQTRDDPIEYEAELVSVTVDGESSDYFEDIDLMMSWIYGHDLEEEYGDYYEEQDEPDDLGSLQQGGSDDVSFITLEELDRAYDENSIVFEQTYLNKYYYVEGEISYITTSDNFPEICLLEETSDMIYSAHFYFNDFPQEIYDLKAGDHITLMGRLEFYGGFNDASIYSVE